MATNNYRRFSNPAEALEARTHRDGECLIWEGPTFGDGYPRLAIGGGRRVRAHRWVWEQEHGPAPEGAHIDHICHRPLCVSVDHLRPATPQQNSFNRAGARGGTGFRNVYRTNSSPTFWVGVKLDGKMHTRYGFPTAEAAAVVAEELRAELFGAFAGAA